MLCGYKADDDHGCSKPRYHLVEAIQRGDEAL